MLKVTLKDKDERKGKQKSKCVVCMNREQTKNHIKDRKNESLKELLAVLFQYKKVDGRVFKTSLHKPCEAI